MRSGRAQPLSTEFPYQFGSGPSRTSPGSTSTILQSSQAGFRVSSQRCRNRARRGTTPRHWFQLFFADYLLYKQLSVCNFYQKHGNATMTHIAAHHSPERREPTFILPCFWKFEIKLVDIFRRIQNDKVPYHLGKCDDLYESSHTKNDKVPYPCHSRLRH